MDAMLASARAGNVRALARLLTAVEDGGAPSSLLTDAYTHAGQATIVGMTGAPGSGKSTLCDALIRWLRAQGHTVAVLAVDPSSPHSGGALLGDRIRMLTHAGDAGVFVRSMATRGQLGGVARATHLAATVLDACGWPVILIETVGVGQSEIDISAVAHTTVAVLTAGAGDSIQMMKAGILEVADIFAINKCDQPDTPTLLRDVRAAIAHDTRAMQRGWLPHLVQTEATQGRGIADLWAAIQQHRAWLASAAGAAAREGIAYAAVLSALRHLVDDEARQALAMHRATIDAVADHRIDPDSAARHIYALLKAPID